jgi:hypothetical protein
VKSLRTELMTAIFSRWELPHHQASPHRKLELWPSSHSNHLVVTGTVSLKLCDSRQAHRHVDKVWIISISELFQSFSLLRLCQNFIKHFTRSKKKREMELQTQKKFQKSIL